MKVKSHVKNISFMILNEIKKMYSGSILGVIWFFLNPLLYSLVYYFLFEKILQVKFTFKSSYFEYLIIGLVLWNSFANGILRGASSILDNSYIIKKVLIPMEYFPIIASFIPFIQGILFLMILIPFLGYLNFIHIFLFLIAAINFYMFQLGLSFLLSSLSVYIRDIPQFLNSFLNFLFYSVPIIYPYENTPDFFRTLLSWNPLFYIFKPFHDILFYKELSLETILIGSGLSLLILFVGSLLFRHLKSGFYDVL